MKKIMIFILSFSLLIVIGVTTYINFSGIKKLESNKIDHLEMIMLPSPPHYKYIDKKEDINQILHIINESKPRLIGFDNQKGWNMMMKFSNNTIISFVSNYLIINNIKYELSESSVNEMKKFYTECASEEKLYVSEY